MIRTLIFAFIFFILVNYLVCQKKEADNLKQLTQSIEFDQAQYIRDKFNEGKFKMLIIRGLIFILGLAIFLKWSSQTNIELHESTVIESDEKESEKSEKKQQLTPITLIPF